MPVMAPAVPVVVDERAARRDLRDQIARLERELARDAGGGLPAARARARAAAPPRRRPVRACSRWGSSSASATSWPTASRRCASNRAAELLEQMRLAPERHRWETVTSADLGEPGCRVWQVRPRLGLVGMLMGWWRVKISSGCPLPG